jgi:hypothetical protein
MEAARSGRETRDVPGVFRVVRNPDALPTRSQPSTRVIDLPLNHLSG